MKKSKKLLSLFMAVVMLISVFSAVSLVASANEVDGGAIALNEEKEVTIANEGDICNLSFTPTVDGVYTFYSLSADFDIKAYIFDSADKKIASNDDGFCVDDNNANFYVFATLQAGKTYKVQVAFYRDTQTGTFKVKAIKNTLTNKGEVALEQQVQFNFAGVEDIQSITFKPSQDKKYYFKIEGDLTSYTLKENGLPYFDFFNTNYIINYDVGADQTYTIEAHGCAAGTQSKLTIYSQTLVDDGVMEGFSKTATVTKCGEEHLVRFTPDEFNFYEVLLDNATTFDVYYMQNGVKESISALGDTAGIYRLEKGVEYYFKITPNYNELPVQLKINLVKRIIDKGAITLGAVKLVKIENAQDIFLYKFTPSKSGVYKFLSSNSSEMLDPIAHIYDSDNNFIITSDDMGEDRNFGGYCYMTAGKTYYMYAKGYKESKGTMNISIVDGSAEHTVHDFDFMESVPATCTTDGYELQKCKICALKHKANIEPKLGHDDLIESTPATYESTGTYRAECARCGRVVNEVLPKKVLAKPVVKVTNATTAIKLSWQKVNDANSYIIYQYNPTTKKYTKVATTTALSYTIAKRAAGTTYYYLVRAYHSGLDGNAQSPFTSADLVKAVTLPAAPKASAKVSAKTVTLKWAKVTGAKYYVVYKYNTKTKKYSTLKKLTGTSLKLTKQPKGNNYYLVRAFNINNAGSAFTTKNLTKAVIK